MIDLREEMREEMLQEQRDEALMRTDFDYWCERHEDEIEAFNEAYKALEKALEHYGWTAEKKDILDFRN